MLDLNLFASWGLAVWSKPILEFNITKAENKTTQVSQLDISTNRNWNIHNGVFQKDKDIQMLTSSLPSALAYHFFQKDR